MVDSVPVFVISSNWG